MDLNLRPKPEVEFSPADKGIVSRKEFFIKKKFEHINENCFPVHYIRKWKPKAELIYPPVADESAVEYEYDFNRDVQNYFVEDYAEEVYLKTPPPCFVVFGKFGQSVSRLSKQIAEEFESVLIQVDDIVNEVIKRQTETSKFVDRILRSGASLTLNFILALLSYVSHTAEARHRGYVLSGLPSLPLGEDLSINQQLNYIFTWENKPTVFINVLFEDEDLIKERTKLLCEIKSTESEKSILYHLDNEEFSDEDEAKVNGTEELSIAEEITYEKNLFISPSRPRFQLPRNEENRVWYELELYDNIIKPAIELIIKRVDPQYVISVDSRVGNEFQIIKARLSLLQVWKAPTATPFISLKENEKDDFEENEEKSEYDLKMKQLAEDSPETAFLKLFTKNTISPKFRWELSHYNYTCPVSMRDGKIIDGKSAFAVTFLKYIYFLHDEECMMKFIKNPRAYVLPIRPRPLCRFFILGYPFSGKTTLAKTLATKYSIPLIDANVVLKDDLERKKKIYQEFCRQKEECREIIRLTSQAWTDWRMEEEQRITLIEDWVLYIQILLSQRIDEFYSGGSRDDLSGKCHQFFANSPMGSCESAGICPEDDFKDNKKGDVKNICVPKSADSVKPSQLCGREPSYKLLQALKNREFALSQKSLASEANAFFSYLWLSFSKDIEKQGSNRYFKVLESDIDGEDGSEFEYLIEDEDNTAVNWCSLLPPQSLSSFLMNKTKVFTTRERRESFKILLEAASKAYWAPSALKAEFAKWRLPCFMDIPLCETFLNNPIHLLHYVPDWLKERPLIPEPVDPMHPSVVEAGNKAFLRAGVVTVQQNLEEVGILIGDAIEKAEREGMRVTGEIISPGGWVVDNMSLDIKVWNELAERNLLADHIYILTDTEPDYWRIINKWWDLHGKFLSLSQLDKLSEEEKNSKNSESDLSTTKFVKNSKLYSAIDVISQEDDNLDVLYEAIIDSDIKSEQLLPSFPIDLFSQDFLKIPQGSAPKDDEEALLTIQTFNTGSFLNPFSLFYQQPFSDANSPLGHELEVFTEQILQLFKENLLNQDQFSLLKNQSGDPLTFFISLLSLPEKLEKLKSWVFSLKRGETIHEIEMTGKSNEEVFDKIQKDLMKPFIKKPRELEDFEIDEIKKSTELSSSQIQLTNTKVKLQEEVFESELENEEDIRIYGESGRLCIVNLEKNIFLPGKIDFILRYYGKLYYFWNEEAKNKFLEDPEKYAPYYSAIRCYPPIRVYVMGPIGCGKTSVVKPLAKQFGLASIDYLMYLKQCLIPHSEILREKFFGISQQKLLLSEDHNAAAKLAKENFINASFPKRQFWLENFYYSDLLENKKFIDKVIYLNEPITSTVIPELIFKSIKVMPEENYDEDYPKEISNSNLNLPKTPYTSMKEIENIISEYIKNNSDLTEYCFDKSFRTLWTKEPYSTKGFVLEGYPMRFFDAENITKNNYIPDLIIEIELSEEEIVNRNINTLLELRETKLQQEIVDEKLLQDTLTTLYKVNMILKRNEITKEKREEAYQNLKSTDVDWETHNPKVEEALNVDLKKEAKTTKSSMKKTDTQEKTFLLPEEIEMEIQNDVDTIIKEFFPPMSFNPIFESYDAGKARLTANLVQEYKRSSAEIQKLKTALTNLKIPWLVVDGLKSVKEITNDLSIKLDTIKRRLGFKGEFAFIVKMETAEKLLKQGYYFLSKFGRWCPVQVYRMKNSIHMYQPLLKKSKITPIVYRNYIYFVGGENEKHEFINNPIKFTFNNPHHPIIPLRIAVIGPPKSGKSTLCKRLGSMFDLKVVTMGSALRFVLEKISQSTLAKSIKDYLQRGCFLPLSLKVQALMVCLNDPSCATQGFIFDGIPFDAALTQSLAEKGKLPFVIISLVADFDFGRINRQNLDLQQFRLPFKSRVNLSTRYTDWNDTYKRFAQWNQNTYNNLYEVNAKLSVVDIFYKAYDIIRESFFGILYYVEHCISNRALPLRYLCVSQHEYELRKSPFHNNCPVCWVELSRLSSRSDPPPRRGLVQYLSHFYWVCCQHMAKFLKNPKIYLYPIAPKFPELLPQRLNKSLLEKNPEMKIHGFGRCPVTKTDFPSSLDWEGCNNFAAVYADEIFLCKNQEMLDRFLARPWRYYKADTRFEVDRPMKSNAVEILGPPRMTSLPPVGFLEQTVADLIHDCLQVLSGLRPVYPNMSPAVTGCVFVALYLKVHNKKRESSSLDRFFFNYMYENCKVFSFQSSKFQLPSYIEDVDDKDLTSEEGHESESLDDEEDVRQSVNSSEIRTQSMDAFWLDFEARAEKKIWSAKNISDKFALMKITSKDELVEIEEHPQNNVVIEYQTHLLRCSPLPSISNCLTFLYSCKPNIKLPEVFNYRTLYESPPLYCLPVSPMVRVNPEKVFSQVLYTQSKSSILSKTEINKTKILHYESSAEEFTHKPEETINLDLVKNRFIPRFQVFDKIKMENPPETPKVIELEPIKFNPYQDYTYMVMFAQFFCTTGILRCYEWKELYSFLEFSNKLDKNLGLTSTQVEYFSSPKKSKSIKSWTSIDSYQQIFDAANTFLIHSEVEVSKSETKNLEEVNKLSLMNFVQGLIFEKLDQMFSRVSKTSFSYDSYEINILLSNEEIYGKSEIILHEVLPYPPLPWDIISRPYYAYSLVSAIFDTPVLDNIAHEKHVSLLDGLTDVNDNFKFVPYPTVLQNIHQEKESANISMNKDRNQMRKSFYFTYDIFNIPWSSFLTYPFFWTYNSEEKNRVVEHDQNSEFSSQEQIISKTDI